MELDDFPPISVSLHLFPMILGTLKTWFSLAFGESLSLERADKKENKG